MTIKNRLAQLEKRANERPAQRVQVIEVHKSYEDGHTEIETIEVNSDESRLEAMQRLSGEIASEASAQGVTAADNPALALPLTIAEVSKHEH